MISRRLRSPRRIVALLWGVSGVLGLLLVWLLWGDRSRDSGKEEPLCTRGRPCLALVVDDVGRDLAPLRALLALGVPMTFAVLPHARHTPASLQALRGREVLLHLPMRPLDRSAVTDEPVVVGLDGDPAAALALGLSQVPGAVGVSNHMGSAASTDEALLSALMPVLRARRLPVLDSRTVAGSRICPVARREGVRCLSRDVFLDDQPGGRALERQLRRAAAEARARGSAIAIAHNRPETVRLLAAALPRLKVALVPLSRLVPALSDRQPRPEAASGASLSLARASRTGD